MLPTLTYYNNLNLSPNIIHWFRCITHPKLKKNWTVNHCELWTPRQAKHDTDSKWVKLLCTQKTNGDKTPPPLHTNYTLHKGLLIAIPHLSKLTLASSNLIFQHPPSSDMCRRQNFTSPKLFVVREIIPFLTPP